jgi:hypothetical protein
MIDMDGSSIREQQTCAYALQNNYSQELKETKDKVKEIKDFVDANADSAELSEGLETRSNDGDKKSSKDIADSKKHKGSTKSSINNDSYESSGNNPVKEKDLTVLFYKHGSGDRLGEYSGMQLIDLEGVGSTDNINLVAQYIRKEASHDREELIVDGGWEGAKRYFIKKDDSPEFEPITLERLLDVSKDYPDNAYFDYAISKKHRDAGDEEKAQEYFSKAVEIESQRNWDKKSYFKEYVDVVEEEFCSAAIFQQHLYGFDRAGETAIKSEVLEELPEIIPGEEPAALQDFIEWGMENYPAENYVLVIGAHGYASKGVAYMSPSEMSNAVAEGVKNANEKTGRDDRINATVFNSCYMGSLEVVTEMMDNSDIIITSQNIVGHPMNFQWDSIIEKVQDNINEIGNFDVRQFAKDFIDYFRVDENDEIAKYYPNGINDISAIDTGKIPELLESFNNLLKTCDENGVTDNQLFKAVADAAHFEEEQSEDKPRLHEESFNLKDFGSFLKNLQKDTDIPDSVRESAEKTLEKLEDTIINRYGDGKVEGTTGLTIWAVDNAVDYKRFYDFEENVPTFVEKSGWNDRQKEASEKISEDILEDAMGKYSEAYLQQLFNIEDGLETAIESANKAKEKTSFLDKENTD